MTVFLSAAWAYVCITMVLKKQSIVKNTGVLLLTAKMAVNVNIPVRIPNMEEPATFSKRIIWRDG